VQDFFGQTDSVMKRDRRGRMPEAPAQHACHKHHNPTSPHSTRSCTAGSIEACGSSLRILLSLPQRQTSLGLDLTGANERQVQVETAANERQVDERQVDERQVHAHTCLLSTQVHACRPLWRQADASTCLTAT
jgi:hypothetical protein